MTILAGCLGATHEGPTSPPPAQPVTLPPDYSIPGAKLLERSSTHVVFEWTTLGASAAYVAGPRPLTAEPELPLPLPADLHLRLGLVLNYTTIVDQTDFAPGLFDAQEKARCAGYGPTCALTVLPLAHIETWTATVRTIENLEPRVDVTMTIRVEVEAPALPAKVGTFPIPADWAEQTVEFEDGHDHRNPSHHRGRSTANFGILGHEPLVTDHTGSTVGGHLCGDATENDGRRLAVSSSSTGDYVHDVAFVLADITDPRNPYKVGEYVLPNTPIYDVALTPDQRFVVLISSPEPDMTTPSNREFAQPYWRDACTGLTTPFAGPESMLPLVAGLILVDIKDPRQPTLADYLPFGYGHSVRAAKVAERTFVLATVGPPVLIEIVESAGRAQLVPLGSFTDCGPPTHACHFHDAYLQVHPVTGQHLAYLANGCTLQCTQQNLAIFNIGDPLRPEFLASWDDWSALGPITPQYLHGAYPISEVWDGRHYTLLGEECGQKACYIVLLDTTDPRRPLYVGNWTLPVVPPGWNEDLAYSLHYVTVSGRTMFVSNYHGGLWAVDLSTSEALSTQPTIGVFVPDRQSPSPDLETCDWRYCTFAWTPNVADVITMSDGTLLVIDSTSGFYLVSFDETHPAPAPTRVDAG